MPMSGFSRCLIWAFLSALFGTSSAAEPLDGNLSTGDGFVDIDLPIVQAESKSSALVSIIARGKIQGSVVGFAVEFSSKWIEKPTGNKSASFYTGKARLRSIGPDSDAFSKLLAGLYQLPCTASTMPSRIDVDVVGLLNDPRLMMAHPTKMKLFFNSNSERDYAEVYLNLDPNSKVLEFHEKDPTYRAPLLRALCSKS